MSERHQHAPRCVPLLADSLDSILAACEDLLIPRAERFRLELAAITHVLQARRHMEELDAVEPEVLDQCALFLAGTASLELARVRSGEPVHPQLKSLSVSDSYLIGGHMPLGALAHLAGTVLDVLEAHYVLYDDQDQRGTDERAPELATAA
jgi:hypothetical protein